MDRKRRTKIFIDFANDEVRAMAKELKNKYEVDLIQEPTEGLTMIKVRETAKNTLFYMGEVLVTECKVRLGGVLGIGIVKGKNEDLSEALAIVDAAFEAKLPETAHWIKIFEQVEQRALDDLKVKRSLIARTKVDFEMMND